MTAQRLILNDFLAQSKDQLIIDVRSPAEYNHAYIPGAVSIPLFNDEERKEVGTAYKQKSREQAIKIGLDFFGPKMRKMVEEVESILEKRNDTIGSDLETSTNHHSSKTVFIYCWRGGMRSGALSWLLSLYGFKVFVLAGGYKAFRNGVLKTFQFPWQLKVLGGYTGSGKTEVLHALKNAGEPVIDLEGIAVHKGSAFGNINLPPQPTQEQFENLLAAAFHQLNNNQPIWIEDESQRIGSINIPGALWHTIRQSPVYFLDVPFDERLQHIVEEYGQLDKEKVAAAIQRITKRLGGLETKNALRLLEEDKWSECFSILLKYYDKHYYKSLHNREGLSALLHQVKCAQAGLANVRYLLNETPA